MMEGFAGVLMQINGVMGMKLIVHLVTQARNENIISGWSLELI